MNTSVIIFDLQFVFKKIKRIIKIRSEVYGFAAVRSAHDKEMEELFDQTKGIDNSNLKNDFLFIEKSRKLKNFVIFEEAYPAEKSPSENKNFEDFFLFLKKESSNKKTLKKILEEITQTILLKKLLNFVLDLTLNVKHWKTINFMEFLSCFNNEKKVIVTNDKKINTVTSEEQFLNFSIKKLLTIVNEFSKTYINKINVDTITTEDKEWYENWIKELGKHKKELEKSSIKKDFEFIFKNKTLQDFFLLKKIINHPKSTYKSGEKIQNKLFVNFKYFFEYLFEKQNIKINSDISSLFKTITTSELIYYFFQFFIIQVESSCVIIKVDFANFIFLLVNETEKKEILNPSLTSNLNFEKDFIEKYPKKINQWKKLQESTNSLISKWENNDYNAIYGEIDGTIVAILNLIGITSEKGESLANRLSRVNKEIGLKKDDKFCLFMNKILRNLKGSLSELKTLRNYFGKPEGQRDFNSQEIDTHDQLNAAPIEVIKFITRLVVDSVILLSNSYILFLDIKKIKKTI